MQLSRRQYQLAMATLIACAVLLGALAYAKPWTSPPSGGNSVTSGDFGNSAEFSFPPLSAPAQPSLSSVSTDGDHVMAQAPISVESPAFPTEAVVNPGDLMFGDSEQLIVGQPADLTGFGANSVGRFHMAGSVASGRALNQFPSARSRAGTKGGGGGGASGGVPSSRASQRAKNDQAGGDATASTMGTPNRNGIENSATNLVSPGATGLFVLTEFPGNGRSGLGPFTAPTNLGQPVPVPEPSSLFLLAGAIALAVRRLSRS